MLPLLLAVWGGWRRWRRGESADRRFTLLLLIGLFGAVYATGWLLPVFRHLPGFGYFRGPARYGVLTTLCVALYAGRSLSAWSDRNASRAGSLLVMTMLVITIGDLWLVSQHAFYAVIVGDAPINHRHESAVGAVLARYPGDARVLAPGPNLATLSGHAATPPYLGFGPGHYYQAGGRLPDPEFLRWLSGDEAPRGIDPEPQFEWMRSAGVTHLLSMKRLPTSWPIEEVWSGLDPLLNRAWARQFDPLHLYQVRESPGRCWFEGPAGRVPVEIAEYSGNRVVVTFDAPESGTLVLADLPWPGWRCTIDGVEMIADDSGAEPAVAASLQRRVKVSAGKQSVAWEYRPAAFVWGLAIAGASLVGLALLLKTGLEPSRTNEV
ncbi:MAG: hypothetical protein R3B90_12250 [Planctomycetaceae bacterium]